MHLRIWLLTLLSIAYSCTAQQENTSEKYTNRLVDESSPYLLQHAHNPVDWYPWTDEAFTKAKEDDKLVIVSIGYAACHWCHVMEHESFEDTAVARLMNERFVSVKVDREERPDVDDVYMNACQLTSQRGCGWPLNAICLPNGQPIFVGTYLPKNQWVQVLERLDNLFHANPDKAYDFAAQLTQGIQALQLVEDHDEELQASAELLENFTTNLLTNQDLKRGGRKGAPKFPMPTVYQYLLQYQYYYDNPQALETVLNTLNKMTNGGIYDPLGGGFARYSTDDEWKVPHFEKMLYDNGQLVSLYAQVYKLTKNEDYKEIITETLDFVERELTDESGGFYSSLDADSEGEEGKFYIWELNEVEEILGQDSELFAEYYQLEEKGNWEEEKNILLKAEEQDELLTKFDLSSSELSKKINQAERKLFEARSKRIRPGLDDKIITSWNALMLEGYVDAYMAWGEEKYLQRAIKNASFIKTEVLQEDYRLYRIHKAGKSSINGFLDDYAITIRAFTALYQATFDEQWLYDAKGMLEYALKHFEDSSSVFFYYTSGLDDPLISRQRIINDNVIPSSNAYMCQNLLQLGTYFDKQEWLNLAKDMLAQVQPQMNQYPDYHTQWGQALMQIVHQPYEVAIVGDNYQSMLKDIGKQYLPDAWYLGGKDEGTLTLLTSKLVEGQTTIYVCQQKVCKLPVLEVEKALGLIGK